MFTANEIKQIRSQVKTRADVPNFVKDITRLGVKRYVNYVVDGHTVYYNIEGNEIQGEASYPATQIASKSNKEYFIKQLREYQNGKSDYLAFCRMCANVGVEKWIVDMDLMTCTYCDKKGFEVLVDAIPAQSNNN